ncbi:hypothetical protein BJ875DRAFT_3007 [Amylocarpus encephaloides]|uniref:Serine/threonine-protein kinase ppk6 n=1 Tax=Amylocarpus encephaloides TaxID=45428 RepID=A0A9P7YV46_9HELO|nr:hypothetical protein BJ875DRAFT_3007 [Amylocarpus encephaloides]
MSADLLAAFDSFYVAPSDPQKTSNSASNDLAFLGSTNSQNKPSIGRAQWQAQPIAQPAVQQSHDVWGDMASLGSTSNNVKTNTADDDAWGFFEGPTEPLQRPSQQTPQSFSPIKSKHGGGFSASQTQGDFGMDGRSAVDLFSSNAQKQEPMPNISHPVSQELPPQISHIAAKSPFGEVLFDAGDELSPDLDNDDEFGDFETFTSPGPLPRAPEPQPIPSQSLNMVFNTRIPESKPSKKPVNLMPISPGLNNRTLPYPQAPKSPSFREKKGFGQLGRLSTNKVETVKKSEKQTSASPVTAWPSFVSPKPDPYQDSLAKAKEEDDDWGDFTGETLATKSVETASVIEADSWGWDGADQVAPKPVEVPPPTNVPPPSVLLALFQPLFDLPQNTLFKGVINQPFSMKNRILSDPSTANFLRAYLLIAIVAARVIAGRKLRWKRDIILSQAVKIGPAAAGGKGGMKLTGVDKAEITREDREAADVVRVWKDQLGRLRSTIAVANASMKNTAQHLVIPEITETMHVKVQEGVMTAPKPCVICGLKREERIAKVDIGVEDSFGEWWVEHWGHRACKNLWEEHESKLKHR